METQMPEAAEDRRPAICFTASRERFATGRLIQATPEKPYIATSLDRSRHPRDRNRSVAGIGEGRN